MTNGEILAEYSFGIDKMRLTEYTRLASIFARFDTIPNAMLILKKLILLIILGLSSTSLFAQEDYVTTQKEKAKELLPVCPKLFLGPSLGINNNAGIIGNNIEYGVAPNFSLSAGFGLSVWGLKGFVEGKYYFKECYKGLAVGLGVTRNGGIPSIEYEDADETGTLPVNVMLLPQTNIALQGYYYFKLGKRHRFHLCGGYSFETSSTKYKVHGTVQPGFTTREAIKILAPGGLILGFGVSFGL